MNTKRTLEVVGIIVCCLALNASSALGESLKTPCVPSDKILDLVAKIPKNFPYSEKDNVYTIKSNSHGALTVTIDGLRMRFFYSLDSDKKKWGSVANNMDKNALKQPIEKIGCVVAGINNFNSGKVDTSEGAIGRAQSEYNKNVELVGGLLSE